MISKKEIKFYSLKDLDSINFIKPYLSKEDIFEIKVVGTILPFKTNNYVADNLIDWDNIPDDPIYTLTFPRKEMLSNNHFAQLESLIQKEVTKEAISSMVNKIRT